MSVDVAAIRARLAAATQWPWWSEDDGDSWNLYGGGAPIDGWAVHGSKILKAPKHGTSCAEYWPDDADADLITNAPADLAALCDEVDAARTAVTRLVKAIDAMRNPSVDGDDCQHCGEGYCEDGCALCHLFTVRDALLDYPCPTVRAAALADGEATG